MYSQTHSVTITAGPVTFSIHANSINIAMHYNSDVRFIYLFIFNFRADCVIRNASFKLKFQGRSERNLYNDEFAIQHGSPPFTLRESCVLHCLFFCVIKRCFLCIKRQHCATSTSTRFRAFTLKLSTTTVCCYICEWANNADDNKWCPSCFSYFQIARCPHEYVIPSS